MPALKIAYRDLAELARLVGQLGSHAVMFVCAFLAPSAKTGAMVVALSSQLAASRGLTAPIHACSSERGP